MFDVREMPTARDTRREEAQRRLEALGKRTLQQVEAVGLQPGVGRVSRVEAEHGTRGSEIEQPTQLTLQALREMAGALQAVHGAAMRSGVAQSPEFRARTGAVQQSLSRASQLLRSGALRDHAQAGQTVAVLHQLSSEISQLPAVDATAASGAPAARPAVPATTLSLGLSDVEQDRHHIVEQAPPASHATPASSTSATPSAWSQIRHPFATYAAAQNNGMAREVDAQASRDASLQREPETYFGTSTPVRSEQGPLNPETGRPYERVVGGSSVRADDGHHWSWTNGTIEQVNSTTRVRSAGQGDGRAVFTTTNRDADSWSLGGMSRTQVQSHGASVQRFDFPAMATAATTQLQQREATLRNEHAAGQARLAQIRETWGSATQEQRRTMRRERQTIQAREQQLRGQIQAVERALPEVSNADPDALRSVVDRFNLTVTPQYTSASVDHATTRTTAVTGLGAQYTRTQRDTRSTEAGSTTTTTSDGGGADLLRGTANYGTSTVREQTETATGLTERTASSSRVGVAAANGTLTGTRTTRASENHSDELGNTVAGSANETRVSGGLVANSDEIGLTAGRATEGSAVVGGAGSQQTSDVNGQITTRGISGSAQAGIRATGEHHADERHTRTWSVGPQVGGNGAFRTDIRQIEGSVPPRFQVEVTLSAGASLGVSGEHLSTRSADETAANPSSGSRTLSAGASVSGSAALTFRHQMTEQELNEYVTGLNQAASGAAPTGNPEFGVLARMRALRAQGGNATSAASAVFSSPDAAGGMRQGESIELSLQGEVAANASVAGERGAFGGSIEASTSRSTSRTVRIERGAGNAVTVVVAFGDGSTGARAASATFEGVRARAGTNSAQSATQTVSVRLDTAAPDYAQRYQRVCNATSIAEVRALATEFTQEASQSSGSTLEVGDGAQMLAVSTGQTQQLSSSVTTRIGEVEGNFSGGQTTTASVAVGGTRLLSTTSSDTVNAAVGSAGIDVTIEHQQADTDVARSAGAIPGAVGTWWRQGTDASRPADRQLGTLAQAVTTSPLERLRTQLQVTYTRLSESSLVEADVARLVERARDQRNWGRCVHTHRIIQAWEVLRQQLIAPHPEAEWVTANPEQANQLARARAMAQFAADHGSDATEAFNHCLYRWGEVGESISRARDIGTQREWPSAITSRRAPFLATRTFVRDASSQFATMLGLVDGPSRARATFDAHMRVLQETTRAIDACGDFESPRAKMELLNEITDLTRALQSAWSEYRPVFETPGGRSMAPQQSDAECVSDAQAGTHIVAAEAIASVASPEQQQYEDKLQSLRRYKSEERLRIDAARALIPRHVSPLGTLSDSTWDMVFHEDLQRAVLSMSSVADLHESWITQIQQLRDICRRLHMPEAQWPVSTGPGSPRKPTTEPDIERLISIYTAHNPASTRSSLSLSNRLQIAAQWRRRFNDY